MRALRVVPPGPGVLAALRAALAGGDAIMVGSPAPDLPAEVEQRVALVVETSGSTGRPKRVALSADAVLVNAAASESALGGPGQWVLALPTHYIAGLNVLTRSIAAQLDPVAVEGATFTAAGFVAAAQRMTVPERFTALVPAQLATLLDDPGAATALAGFQRVLVGGQGTPAPLLARAKAAGVRVTRSYGSSETSGGCVYDGSPIGQTEVRVVDGEVHLGGPTIAEGYLADPELTAARFVEELGMRWFRTADAGTLDDGRVTVTGRLDDVIISGGVKVSLSAIERLLRENGFDDAVVVTAQHEKWGEMAVAFTARTSDPAPAIAAIEAALGPAARPLVRGGSVIPVLPSGKPDRVTLQAKATQ
ncbi:AMP-binding protein [Pseudolysinimonas sp.]|uniref:AMP-binding protein n=1 Tax=Pseudolysinimonas sp. TaxID=2680009 RepID=UPI00286C037C|nr:AMP-binding protein [Pseudolysinimonas sp.]